MSLKQLVRLVRDWVHDDRRKGSKVLPSLADEKVATGAAGAWAYGVYTEVVADSGAVLVEVDGIEVISIAGDHQVELAVGAAGSEVGAGVISAIAVGYHPVKSGLFPKNSRIAVRTASKAGGGQTVGIKVHYREVSY
ncbi:MAG: hypothetical protein CMK74_20300 [Pseudomonadales bacterium]|nr:hypothetical protein [Pseudomonadales bacterium]